MSLLTPATPDSLSYSEKRNWRDVKLTNASWGVVKTTYSTWGAVLTFTAAALVPATTDVL